MGNRYLVKLTPVGKYYFGSENSFNAEDKTKGGRISNYLVRSRKYPQQTTLLGMMRYAILQQYDLLDKSKRSEWASNIGSQSFNGLASSEKGEQISDWGLIKEISPLFLLKNDSSYLPAGLDTQQYYKSDCDTFDEVTLTLSKKEGATSNYGKEQFYWLKEYDPKQYTFAFWKKHKGNELLNPDEIFAESFQVGITKSREGKPENDAFYKEFFYQLKEDTAFAFYLNTSEPLRNFDSPIIIQSGGDQSLFRLDVSNTSDNIFESAIVDGKGKFTMLSDAYVDSGILLPLCDACITSSVDFRFMQTTTTTERYYNVSSRNTDMRKSKKMNLLERGSVLFTSDAKAVAQLLNNNELKPYRNAGFNYYSFETIN